MKCYFGLGFTGFIGGRLALSCWAPDEAGHHSGRKERVDEKPE